MPFHLGKEKHSANSDSDSAGEENLDPALALAVEESLKGSSEGRGSGLDAGLEAGNRPEAKVCEDATAAGNSKERTNC